MEQILNFQQNILRNYYNSIDAAVTCHYPPCTAEIKSATRKQKYYWKEAQRKLQELVYYPSSNSWDYAKYFDLPMIILGIGKGGYLVGAMS
jgi:hypothetical protein